MNCPNCKKAMQGETCRCGFSAVKNYLRIDQMYAYVSVDEDGNEGIIAFQSSQGPMPMVGADMERMKSMKHIAQQVAKNSGIKVRLLKFSTREELETIG